MGKVSFLVAAAADVAAEAVIDADVVVVDPPRKGLDARTLAALAGHDGAHDGEGVSDEPNEVPNKPPDLSTDPRRGKQGAAGSGRKKRNKRNRRAKKRLNASEDVSFAHFALVQKTPPPPDRLRTLIYVSCGGGSRARRGPDGKSETNVIAALRSASSRAKTSRSSRQRLLPPIGCGR